MTTIRTPAKIIPRAFPGIRPDEIQGIIINSQIRSYPADTVLCREDVYEYTFYMILEGSFEVTKLINNVEKRLLKTLNAGDFFGEMALIHNAPRAATVKSLTPVVVLELSKEGFDKVLKQSPSVSMAMVGEISNRLRQNDQLAIEDLRLRARELADAYQKMAEQDMARREFLTNIAHELRTPLTVASGFLHTLKRGTISGEQLQAAIETISRNVDQIVNLTNDLLFLQEQELVLPDFQPVNLVAIANNIVKKYEEKAKARRVTIKVKGNTFVSPVQGDESSLERALTGLVDNAVKFSPPNGQVEIRFADRGNQVSVSVEDHGIGIDPNIRPRIFDRFFHIEKQGDNLYSGLGIGLSITRQVIQQHRGTLEVDSTPGQGSTFTISLLKWK
ncbi:MAG TPA: ATP-binding protein [Anaerolineales bacterium]|nr:ATP-binding protein [Anaerolineales bacterium]HNA87814.1 ATP-binding protein [Anaerolineales bacterium]HNB34892.1 ATP-binding protein [Anaerolineales bacterium]HNC07153.1 ATP-binding protein [Anaerolineales bacterium]